MPEKIPEQYPVSPKNPKLKQDFPKQPEEIKQPKKTEPKKPAQFNWNDGRKVPLEKNNEY